MVGYSWRWWDGEVCHSSSDIDETVEILRTLRLRLRDELDAIRDEKLVKKLQHAFSAELDEASVVKIENNR